MRDNRKVTDFHPFIVARVGSPVGTGGEAERRFGFLTACFLRLARSPLSFRCAYVTIKAMDVSNLYGGPRHKSFVLGRSKRRALVLHGFPGTPAEMLPLAEILVKGGLEVHGPLLPGFGMDIENLGQTHWQDWVRAAQRAWTEMQEGAEETLLLGFSMGGAVALKLAADPDRLVLLAPFSRLADPRAKVLPVVQYVLPQLKPFQNADFTQEVVRSQFRRLEPTLNLDDPEVQRELREKVVLPTSSLVQLQQVGRAASRAAPRITTPTLVLQGKADTTVSPADTRRLVKRLGGPVTFSETSGTHEFISPGAAGFSEVEKILSDVYPYPPMSSE